MTKRVVIEWTCKGESIVEMPDDYDCADETRDDELWDAIEDLHDDSTDHEITGVLDCAGDL